MHISLWILLALCILIVALRLLRYFRINTRRAELKGKVVLITGASRGIGRALAIECARHGANLVLAARDGAGLAATAAACQVAYSGTEGIHTLVVPTDISVDAQLEHLVTTTLVEFKRIDLLVNNAGILQGGSLIDQPPEWFQEQIETNLLAPLRLTQLVLPHMLAQGAGQIINMSSVLGKHTMPFFTPYAITKHGLDAFGQGLRRELRGTGIHVLTAFAGFAATGMVGAGEAVLRGYGVWIMPPEFVARRVIEALLLRKPEAHIYRIEAFAIWSGYVAPRLVDFLWGLLAPSDLKDIASRRNTE